LFTYFLLSKSLSGNKHGGHVVYVIEQTDQFQKFGKTLVQKYELFKKSKNLI